jgi:hypothetical protein
MARCRGAARRIWRRRRISGARGDIDIASPEAIVRLSGSWALAVPRVGGDGARGEWAPGAQGAGQ